VLRPEHQDRPPDADLIAQLQHRRPLDSLAVDPRPVGRPQVLQHPARILERKQLAVPAAHGVVRDRKLARFPAHERGGVRQFKPATLVGTLKDEERKHDYKLIDFSRKW